jgi:hypothetical protein
MRNNVISVPGRASYELDRLLLSLGKKTAH